MPDDVNQNFTSVELVEKSEQEFKPPLFTDEEYRRRVQEMTAELANQPGWVGKELRRRLACRF